MIDTPPRYRLDLSREEVDYVLEVLSARPWREANGLIVGILAQTRKQNDTLNNNSPSEEPAPDGVANGDQPDG